MNLVYNKRGKLRYSVRPGLEVEFLSERHVVPSGQYPEFFVGKVHFRNSSPDSPGIDLMLAFVAEEPVPLSTMGMRLPTGTDLHGLFLGVLQDGNGPGPFLDMLVDLYPDLYAVVGLFVNPPDLETPTPS